MNSNRRINRKNSHRRATGRRIEIMNLPFDDRTAVITGAAGVLGRAVVRRFHDLGAHVAAIDLSAEALSDVADAACATTRPAAPAPTSARTVRRSPPTSPPEVVSSAPVRGSSASARGNSTRSGSRW